MLDYNESYKFEKKLFTDATEIRDTVSVLGPMNKSSMIGDLGYLHSQNTGLSQGVHEAETVFLNGNSEFSRLYLHAVGTTTADSIVLHFIIPSRVFAPFIQVFNYGATGNVLASVLFFGSPVAWYTESA